MMWRNVWAVWRREYIQRVRSKWFAVATVGGPFIMALLIVVTVFLTDRSEDSRTTIAVVDETNVLSEPVARALEQAGWVVRTEVWEEGTPEALMAEIETRDLGGFLVLDGMTLSTGEARLYSVTSESPLRLLTIRSAVSQAALEYHLGRSDADAAALLQGGTLSVDVIDESSAYGNGTEFWIAYGGAFLLYMVILIYASAVMRATLDEKASRVVELILSSMEPWHLMLGKILGVWAVSMTQIVVRICSVTLLIAAGIPLSLSGRYGLPELENLSEVLPGPGLWALFVGFFVLGYLMYSGLYAALGAMCSTDQEAQQAQLPMIMLLLVPILMVVPVIQGPTTAASTGLSLFPLFSPILMWARVATGVVPVWQVGLSFILMVLSVFGIAWLAGRIYKAGILMTGKRPTLPELWRWLREA